jgi:hypothetical protein
MIDNYESKCHAAPVSGQRGIYVYMSVLEGVKQMLFVQLNSAPTIRKTRLLRIVGSLFGGFAALKKQAWHPGSMGTTDWWFTVRYD